MTVEPCLQKGALGGTQLQQACVFLEDLLVSEWREMLYDENARGPDGDATRDGAHQMQCSATRLRLSTANKTRPHLVLKLPELRQGTEVLRRIISGNARSCSTTRDSAAFHGACTLVRLCIASAPSSLRALLRSDRLPIPELCRPEIPKTADSQIKLFT